MGTITSLKRKDNSIAYTAQIRINRSAKTVYQESQTFDRKQVAQAWVGTAFALFSTRRQRLWPPGLELDAALYAP
jgi:hypothetical protein